MPCFLVFFLIFFHNTKAALPFVTNNAAIQNPEQLAIEMFAEGCCVPEKSEVNKKASELYDRYISESVGISKRFEVMVCAMVGGYDTKKYSSTYSNVTFQVKAKIFDIATFAGYNIGSLYRQTQWI